MKKLAFIILAVTTLETNLIAQSTTDSINAINKKLTAFIKKQESKILKFGVSVGVRNFLAKEENSRTVAAILPDSTVSIEHGDQLSILLSSSLTAFPFTGKWKNFGFTLNINLVEFTNANAGSLFNKPIDGGLGIAYALDKDKDFTIGLTYERVSILRPTHFVLSKEGQKIISNGKALTSLDKTDDRFYIQSGLNGLSLKFIYHFK